MSISVILHISNEEPILAEIDELPTTTDYILVANNPRKKDGKDLHFIDSSVTQVMWPWTRINFLEILPSEEEDQVFGFVRE